MSVIFKNVFFGYSEIFLENVNCHFDKDWAAVVGANGSGKTTILLLITGELEANKGNIAKKGKMLYLHQRTDEPTNHMDLPSALYLEITLKETESGLLLVSHDGDFLDSIITKEWQIYQNENNRSIYSIKEI